MSRIDIDGSLGEGGGQIIRTAMSLATILGKSIRISNIRAKREKKGLRPSHLQAVLSSAKLGNGILHGASVGSTEIDYIPGEILKNYSGKIDTGTAGSIPLIIQTILPISIFQKIDLDVNIIGGTEVPHSPTIDYLEKVVLPVYRRLGASVELEIKQRGYYPRGAGMVRCRCSAYGNPMPIVFEQPAKIEAAEIRSVSRGLPEHVAQRQLASAERMLVNSGIRVMKKALDVSGTSFSPGSSVLTSTASNDVLIGSCSLGEKGKRAETVGEESSKFFLGEIGALPNVDSHLADMLVTLLACVNGRSIFRTSLITNHFETNTEIAKQIAHCEIEYHKEGSGWLVEISGSSEKPN